MTNKKETLLEFPCEFTIKVFGVASDQFEPAVMDIILKHHADLHESAIRRRPSKDNKYIALSIILHIESKQQLDYIYQDLTASPYVIMAL
jgi:putative lipoic acid-binding regulatory protein